MKTKYPAEIFKSDQKKMTSETYNQVYQYSLSANELFWDQVAQNFLWQKKWDSVKNVNFNYPPKINWFTGGKLNITENCIDRHLSKNAQAIAFIWEPEDTSKKNISITYQELHDHVCQFANLLKSHGVKKGDTVTIYMPMILEAIYAMLACARMGATHSVVFGGFSPQALADRITNCKSKFVITADEGTRGGKKIPLKQNVDTALELCPDLKKIFVIENANINLKLGPKDVSYKSNISNQQKKFTPEIMDAEDPLFILYTSGSTNKPKGLVHTCGGYMVYASYTHELVFNYSPGDIYWCAADIGWITGHSYILYGPLLNGSTSVIYEGLPNFPDASRIWQIVDKYRVNILYTAPTLIRALMAEGDSFVKKTDRSSLKILGSVGEPINPEAWRWYFDIVGEKKSPIVDTWWQTETGGILISPLPYATDLKPGSATSPLPGIIPCLVDEKGVELLGASEGALCLKDSWPGQARTIFGDHERFYQTYFSTFKGKYFTGDGCRRDEDGYYWITGRIDDVLNVSGHRLGTAEIESALVAHPKVAEAAVVGFPHEIKGQGIYAFVNLNKGEVSTQEFIKDLITTVRKQIGAIATPDHIQITSGLPKTRSGKIMRRILRKIAENNFKELGDTSTLADPKVVDELIKNRLIK